MHWGVHDQTIQEYEDNLFSEILLAQCQYDSVHPPLHELIQTSRLQTDALQKLRGSDFQLPSLFSGRGHGPFVEMIDGSVKFDLIGGIGPYLLGHSHPLQIRANLAAARGCFLNSTNFLPAQISQTTSQALIKAATPSSLKHCWFSASGSMANDSALRMLQHKRKSSKRLIAFDQSFAGRTVTMQSLTSGSNQTFDINIDYIPFPIDEASSRSSVMALEKLIRNSGENYLAFYGELLQGEAGVNIPNSDGLRQLFELLKKSSIPIWIDEVQTFARTHQLFAFQHFNLSQYVDICTIGKAFNLSAILYTSALKLDTGLGGTFQGSTADFIYAESLLRLFTHGPFFGPQGRMARLERDIRSMFDNLFAQTGTNKLSKAAHGLGTFWAISLVKSDIENVQRFTKDLYENGIIVWKAGRESQCLRMLFPLTITPQHLDQIGEIFAATLKQAKYLEF